ncbi:iron-siderophore ABC transporter substrate-binding protein [Chloroflexia bacterium SDU3-3]|nr:iron-siderophore ABC transporter substrate-binding protein [Chloroflexia bacterium SDU3-3]
MRKLLISLALSSALLASCQSAPAATAPTEAPAATQAPAATAAPTEAPAATAEASATRTITDAASREVAVPTSPQRIVTISEQDLDGALALGLKPVGSVNGRGQQSLPSYLGDKVAGIESVGSLAEPSLEKIAALKPDIILFGSLSDALSDQLAQMEKIAPVVVTYKLADDWKTAFRGTASALNQDAQAEAFLASYDARVKEVRAALGEHASDLISIVRWNATGPGIMARDAFSSLVARDLGLQRSAFQQTVEGFSHSEPLSMEELDKLDGDWLFVGTLNAEGDAALTAAKESPLFQQLGVVKGGRVVAVTGQIWGSRGGPLASLIVLDEIQKAMGSAS